MYKGSLAQWYSFGLRTKRSRDQIPSMHTPPEILLGTGQFPRPMVNAQLFYGVSGIQNRFDQNFLTRTFSVIAI